LTNVILLSLVAIGTVFLVFSATRGHEACANFAKTLRTWNLPSIETRVPRSTSIDLIYSCRILTLELSGSRFSFERVYFSEPAPIAKHSSSLNALD